MMKSLKMPSVVSRKNALIQQAAGATVLNVLLQAFRNKIHLSSSGKPLISNLKCYSGAAHWRFTVECKTYLDRKVSEI